ncbi:MAG TPA: GNAT family N-acetyltransferase [Vicinamibacterales bacterium]|nr:GNAT family N-acetyltransferase [Vicinamibacterales bacterium]
MVAAPDDIPDLVRVINAAYEVEKFFVSGDRTAEDTVRRLMSKGAFLVTRDYGRLAGCVYVELRGARAYFGMLSVEPARQGSGLGRRLVDEAEQYARDHGCEAMDIRVVNLRSELLPFYRKLGYVERATEPVDDPRALQPFHFILMSKALD